MTRSERFRKGMELREMGWTYRRIADALGMSTSGVDYLLNPTRRPTKTDTLNVGPTAEELRERFRAIPKDTRDLTSKICGDPLPGRSALDRIHIIHRPFVDSWYSGDRGVLRLPNELSKCHQQRVTETEARPD